jgi:hypothetical protein
VKARLEESQSHLREEIQRFEEMEKKLGETSSLFLLMHFQEFRDSETCGEGI